MIICKTNNEWAITANSPEVERRAVSPDCAKFWLSRYEYPKQRLIRKHQVQRLAAAMAAGEFSGNTAHFCVCLEDGKTYQVNAYHTLYAIIECDATQVLTVQVDVVETFMEVRDTYRRIDVGLRRAYSDVGPLEDTAEELGINKAGVMYIQQAAPYILSGFDRAIYRRESYRCTSHDARTRFIEEWGEEGAAYIKATTGAKPITNLLRRTPVIAVGIATFRHAPEKAKEFWSKAASNSNLAAKSPEHTLLEFLRDGRRWKGGFEAGLHYAALVANCWNARVAEKESYAKTALVRRDNGEYNPVPVALTKFIIKVPKPAKKAEA